jgi:hypothetical protein
MPITRQNHDWEEHDNRRIRDGRDRGKVSCEEPWEVDYILKVIRRDHPTIAETNIRKAISECCKTIQAPRFRDQFLNCLERWLNI